MARNFEVHQGKVEITRGGLFGGPMDHNAVFAPGLRSYTIDGVSVTQEVFERELRIDIEGAGITLPPALSTAVPR